MAASAADTLMMRSIRRPSRWLEEQGSGGFMADPISIVSAQRQCDAADLHSVCGISALCGADLKSKTATQNPDLPEFPDVRTFSKRAATLRARERTGYRRGRTYRR